MKTGSDISLRECRSTGYPVVEHFGQKMDPDKHYSLTISRPEVWPDGYLLPGTRVKHAYEVDMFITYKELWRQFLGGGKGIKDFCDFEKCPLPAPDENPSFYDFVSLAGIVNSYKGID